MRKLRRSKAASSLCALGLAGCGGLWLASRGESIPNPTLPSPNAYDDYVEAGRILRDVDSRVLRGGVGPRSARGLASAVPFPKAGEAALRRLRQGFAHRYHQPPSRSFDGGASDPRRRYAAFRNLSRLLVAEGQARGARGGQAGAARSYIDGVRLGVDVAHGAPLGGALVGAACESIARRPFWNALEGMDASRARRAALELEALEERRVQLGQVLLEEKWSVQASLGQSDPEIERGLSERLRGSWARSRTLSDYTPIINARIARARRPYAAPAPPVPAPRDAHSAQWTASLGDAAFSLVRNQAQSALLRTALALHAYSKENGAPPRSLDQLVPRYLRRPPPDPFALGKPLQLRLRGRNPYVLYSIGPDGRDNGGRAIVSPDRYVPSGQNNRVSETSLGDIVAGVNK